MRLRMNKKTLIMRSTRGSCNTLSVYLNGLVLYLSNNCLHIDHTPFINYSRNIWLTTNS
jgi:hypothetical protein